MQAKMDICGRSEDTCEEIYVLNAGQSCTRASIDVLLPVGDMNGGSCKVGMGDVVIDCSNQLFVVKGLFEL